MLRVSAKATNTTIDIQGISGDASAAAMGIEHGPELMRFAESLARNTRRTARVMAGIVARSLLFKATTSEKAATNMVFTRGSR